MTIDYSMYELAILALTVWREAQGETRAAKIAVAFSVLNRVDSPKWWGTSIGAVVAKKWQYSSMAAPGDPNLIKYPLPHDLSFQDSMSAVNAAIAVGAINTVPGADSYWDASIARPKWATDANFVCKVGAFSFHNTDGDFPSNPKVTP